MFVSEHLTPNDDKKLPEMCNEETFQNDGPKVMINVVKLNKEKDNPFLIQTTVTPLFITA